jgi:hypothetical protein
LEIEATHVKSIAVAAAKPPDVLRTDASTETPVLPGTVEMIAGIIASGVVSHPLIPFCVHVRGFGMVRLIAEDAPLIILRRSGAAIVPGRRMWDSPAALLHTPAGRRRLGRSTDRRRTVRGNMSIANTVITAASTTIAATLLGLLTALLFLLTVLLVATVFLGESGKRQYQRYCK